MKLITFNSKGALEGPCIISLRSLLRVFDYLWISKYSIAINLIHAVAQYKKKKTKKRF